ncbi:hypothetical protein ACFX13_040260 [Malus domestica]|uniref:uncharacterized protein LOC126626329 n=1 Tax=Malus sylvestris TaxID=3752 RepID=UPI0010AA594D|nr:uncharacterized protein LOC114825424 [Malus domestica]XP_050151588.1 uncharacterized protein LOC126626329 [Malus sylvestris]XP_050151589.1 uncharacterized protein LOC126626329 [Malus sylvestris]XP_050151590.1 uncharacterized protein LOC126626329 [Malus sylvestris]XP_050151591.1 uncharacterized protein LOC126626329 [Malus sylvestris]
MVLKSTIPGSVEAGKNDVCIPILQSYEIKNVPLRKTRSPQVLGIDISLGGDVQSCKRCRRSESISNMLICDRCEEAFHVKCCKPRVVFPVDDWFCGSCSKIMSEKLQNDSFLKSPSSMGLRFGLTCKFELGPIAVMLKYPEPFTSKVRIGEAYQVEVPDWCHQIPKTPLSEVENDDGDCSLAAVLDPSHSDCADRPPLMGSENGIASRKRKLEMVESP